MIEYLQSGQCKIPWTLEEIKEARKLGFEELMKGEEMEPGDLENPECEKWAENEDMDEEGKISWAE